jgi:hypothetical protein
VSRAVLSLYELDRNALKAVSAELETVLADNDVAGLVKLLELGDSLAQRLDSTAQLVDLFLMPESSEQSTPLFASLRRISKKRALTKLMTSSDPALEGRMRGFDLLRDERTLAGHLDRMLNPLRLPWYLRRKDASCGWLKASQRDALASGMRALAPALTDELVELLEGLEQTDEDVILHDGL